jgi:hypothetical protein
LAIVFDPTTKRITLDSASVTATELYSRSCDWLALADNAKYGAVFRQVGGDDLGAGLSIPPYFFLQGAWRVRPMESSHTLTITGNLFVDGGGDPVVQTLGAFNVLTKSVVPVQAQGIATSGGTAPTAADIWSHAVEGTYTAEEILRIMAAALAGKVSGADSSTIHFRDLTDTKDRITATVDAGGNRTAITHDVL